MKAFILAAGFGKRMEELTNELPKPLLRVDGYPLICYTLFQLYLWKIESVVINVHYLPDLIIEYLCDFPYFPITFSHEKKILGTAGGIFAALKEFENERSFLLINPDTIFFPSINDNPSIPEKLIQDDIAGCLYLIKKIRQSQERGWIFFNGCSKSSGKSFLQDDITFIKHIPGGGDYIYSGYSIVNPASFLHLKVDEFSELGPLWIEKAEEGKLFGKLFQGTIISAGDKTSYLKNMNKRIIKRDQINKWEKFISTWFKK